MDGASAQFKQGSQLVMKLELGDCSNKREDANSNCSISKTRSKEAGFFDSHVMGTCFKMMLQTEKGHATEHQRRRNDFSAHLAEKC